MTTAGGGKNSQDRTGAEAGRRKRRRRTILNLGIPFVPVDDAVNQAEEAFATGFDVLEKVVDEIRKGYELATDYNKKQRQAEAAGEPRPLLPWLQVAERGRELQKVALEAMKKGNDILLDSTRSGMSAAMSFAETLASARTDADEKLPRLAGPVFDSLAMKVAAGEPSMSASWEIRNRGLARLRIHVTAEPLPYRGKAAVLPLNVKKVRFEPQEKSQEISILTVLLDRIPVDQPPGMYEGPIMSTNFELFIGQLRVEVTTSASSSPRNRR